MNNKDIWTIHEILRNWENIESLNSKFKQGKENIEK